MIVVHGRANSSNVQKVLWLFDEIGLAFERIDRGGRFGGLDDPAYRALNPNGLVPTVIDGGLVLWESHAILRHYARQDRKSTRLNSSHSCRISYADFCLKKKKYNTTNQSYANTTNT